MEDKDRARALDLTLGQIEKQFGKGSIIRLGSKDAIVPVAVISTGSISVDAALGVGGFPRGRVIEIYRSGVFRQNHHCAAGDRRSAEAGRHGGVHRRRTCARSRLCQQAGRGRR